MERFERQVIIKEVGEAGQKKLLSSSVLVVGAGGLGSPVLFYLAAMGVGHIHIIDCDVVSKSNLNRQILYGIPDLGKSKAMTAAEKLFALYPDLTITGEEILVTDENAKSLLRGYDCIVPCLDSIESRKIVNRGAVLNNTPYVEGAVSGFHGSMSTVIPHETACYECAFPHANQPAPPIPVLGAVAGIVGSMMVLSAMRLLLGQRDPSVGHIVYIDAAYYENTLIPIERNPSCPVCGDENRSSKQM